MLKMPSEVHFHLNNSKPKTAVTKEAANFGCLFLSIINYANDFALPELLVAENLFELQLFYFAILCQLFKVQAVF